MIVLVMLIMMVMMTLMMFCDNQLLKETKGKRDGNLSKPEQTMGQVQNCGCAYIYKYGVHIYKYGVHINKFSVQIQIQCSYTNS